MEVLDLLINQGEGEDILVDQGNRRIIFYQYDEENLVDCLETIGKDEGGHQIEKVSVYANEGDANLLEDLDLTLEGKIDGFFNGEDAFIYSHFINPDRRVSHFREEQKQIIRMAQDKYSGIEKLELPKDFQLRNANSSDVVEMANVFTKVFKTYPTPMDEPSYIKKVMKEDTLFSLVVHGDRIVSIASADINPKYNNAEITDCATLPEYRGNGLLSYIISHLENRLEDKNVPNLFSLTRAQSVGMNHVIAKHAYEYRGTLVQNCNISGSFEDMNIWVKNLEL